MKIKGKDIPLHRIPEKIIKKTKAYLHEKQLDKKAYKTLLKWKNTEKHDGPIRVCFIVQVPEIWDKEVSIFEAMKADRRFEPVLVVVPYYDRINEHVLKEYKDNYFLKQYPNDSIRAYDGYNWIDLSTYKFDYVFFQRPYDNYLPDKLKSSEVFNYTKCCYIPYGFGGADIFNEGNTQKGFFRNIYFAFLESDYMVDLLKRKFIQKELEIHHIQNLGYPALAPYFDLPLQSGNAILWTPRWSYDPIIGGSNFIEYKDLFIDLADKYQGYNFVFRPHPLMFEELIKKNLMKREEIEKYLIELSKHGIKYDKDTPIFNAIKQADVLITDYSTIIIQYFITGKPIVYCEKNITFNDSYLKLKRGMYTVRDSQELKNIVGQLLLGNDPLKSERQKLLNEDLNIHKYATQSIVECIAKDFDSNCN